MPALRPASRAQLYQHLARGQWRAVERLVADHFPRIQSDFLPTDDAALATLGERLDVRPPDRVELTNMLCSPQKGLRSLASVCLRKLKRGLCIDTLRLHMDALRQVVEVSDARRQAFLRILNSGTAGKHDQIMATLHLQAEQPLPKYKEWVDQDVRQRAESIARGVLLQEAPGPVRLLEEFQETLGSVLHNKVYREWKAAAAAHHRRHHAGAGEAATATSGGRTPAFRRVLLAALESGDAAALEQCCRRQPSATLAGMGLEDPKVCARLVRRPKAGLLQWLAEGLTGELEARAVLAEALLPHVPKLPASALVARHLQLIKSVQDFRPFRIPELPVEVRNAWSRSTLCLLLHAGREVCWQVLIPCSRVESAVELMLAALVNKIGTPETGRYLAQLWDEAVASGQPPTLEAAARLECLREYFEALLSPRSFRDDSWGEPSSDWIRPRVRVGIEEYLAQIARFEHGMNYYYDFPHQYNLRDALERRGPRTFEEFRAAFDQRSARSAYEERAGYSAGSGWEPVVRELWTIHWCTGNWSIIEQQAWPHYRAQLLADLHALRSRCLEMERRPRQDDDKKLAGVVAAALLLMSDPHPVLVELLTPSPGVDIPGGVADSLGCADWCRLAKPWWSRLMIPWVSTQHRRRTPGWWALLRSDLASEGTALREVLARIHKQYPGRTAPEAVRDATWYYSGPDAPSHLAAALVARDYGAKGFRALHRYACSGRMLRIILEHLSPEDPALGAWHWRQRLKKTRGHGKTTIEWFTDEELAGYMASPSSAPLVARMASDLVCGTREEGRRRAARLIIRHAVQLKAAGVDPTSIILPALWGETSHVTRDALRILRALLVQGLSDPGEAAHHLESLFETEEEEAWRSAAKLLKQLRSEYPAVALRNPGRVREIIARDPSRYRKVFKGLVAE